MIQKRRHELCAPFIEFLCFFLNSPDRFAFDEVYGNRNRLTLAVMLVVNSLFEQGYDFLTGILEIYVKGTERNA